MSTHITISDTAGVRTVKIDRPEKKNALTSEMYGAIADAFDDANENSEISAVIIRGEPGAFCAGNDIADFLKFAVGGEIGGEVVRFLRTIATIEKPLVAAVDGLAVGVGTTMLLHCDMVLATPESRFQTPFVDLGLVPEAASSLLAPRLMGHARAFELLCLGAPLDASGAKRCGIVNHVVGSDVLYRETAEIAAKLAAKPPSALAASRSLVRGSRTEILARIDEEITVFVDRLKSPEAREAFDAFMSKK